MDTEPIRQYSVRCLGDVKMIPIAAYEVNPIKATIGHPGDEIDAKGHINDLLLVVCRAIALEKLKALDVAVRTLHR
jgi:hypothetical protein